MSKKVARRTIFILSTVFILCMHLSFNPSNSFTYPQEEEKTKELVIADWLLLGPFINPLPVLHEEQDKKRFIESLINFEQIDTSKLIPKAESPLRWHDGTLSHWREIQSTENGVSLMGDETHPSIAYLGTYLDVQRWTRAKITIQTSLAFTLCIDGRTCITKSEADNNGENRNSTEGKKLSTDIGLETGKHIVLVKSIHDPDSNADWAVKATISFDEKYTSPSPTLTLSCEQHMNFRSQSPSSE